VDEFDVPEYGGFTACVTRDDFLAQMARQEGHFPFVVSIAASVSGLHLIHPCFFIRLQPGALYEGIGVHELASFWKQAAEAAKVLRQTCTQPVSGRTPQ
jgi:hypothetical protein